MTKAVHGDWMLSLVEAESFHFLHGCCFHCSWVAMPHFCQITMTERNVEILKVHEGQELEAKPFKYKFFLWQRALRTLNSFESRQVSRYQQGKMQSSCLAHFSGYSRFGAGKVNLFSTHLHAKLLLQRFSQGINSNNSKTKQTNPKPTNQKTQKNHLPITPTNPNKKQRNKPTDNSPKNPSKQKTKKPKPTPTKTKNKTKTTPNQ